MDDPEESEDEVQYSEMLQPPLIHQLKRILDEYPDDGQILKEIIQNAEDAEASVMRIVYDGRRINQEPINPKHAPFKMYFKGPALCIYNDAIFTEEDWKGIRMIYSSIKEFDPVKVGRFGLGFKSVFHITDYPMIISGKHLLIIDPHQRCSSRVCMTMELKKMTKYKNFDVTDCKTAFDGTFGFSDSTIKSGFFQGTIFRFPLRNEKTDLSENIYDEEKILELFKAFQAEAEVELLFLKCLEKIELETRGTKFDMQNDFECAHFYSVNISDNFIEKIREGRKSIMHQLKTFGRQITNEDFQNSYQMVIESRRLRENKTCDKWLVTHFLKGSEMSEELRKLSLDETLSYSPSASIAIPLTHREDFKGHVFCLMPLPLETNSLTGFPVHVNGYFALSQNRRHVKWPTADQIQHDTYKDKSLRWNTCLIKEVLAILYYNVIQQLIRISKETSNCYDNVAIVSRTIPNPSLITEHWKIIAHTLFERLIQSKFLYTESNGGCWISIEEAVFDVFQCLVSDEIRNVVRKYLLMHNQNVVRATDHVLSIIKLHDCNINTITPQLIARITSTSSLVANVPVDDKMIILQFLLTSEDRSILHGLPLLPLKDGTFTAFDQNSAAVLVCKTESDLFPGLEEAFIKQNISLDVYERLCRMAEIGQFQLQELSKTSPNTIAQLLKKTIDNNIGIPTSDTLSWRLGMNSVVDEVWLKNVWTYLKKTEFRLSEYKELYLLPEVSCRETNTRCTEFPEIWLHRLSKQFILKSYEDIPELSEAVCNCLGYLNIVTLSLVWDEILTHPDIFKFVFKPTLKNIVHLLKEIQNSNASDQFITCFNKSASVSERHEFVTLFDGQNHMVEELQQLLSQLQLYMEKNTGSLVSTADVPLLVEMEDMPVKYCRANLDVGNQSHYNLAVALNVDKIAFDDAVVNVLRCLNATSIYSKNDCNKIMSFVMRNLKRFRNKETILKISKNIEFVYDTDGQTRRACDFFDPENETLQMIIDNKSDFPDIEKTCIDLKNLRMLGLKSLDGLTEEHICRSTKQIHENCVNNECSNRDLQISSKVVGILNSHPHLFNSEISRYHCVTPVGRTPDYPSTLPWFEPHHRLCKPEELLDLSFQNLLGSVKPLVNSDNCLTLGQNCKWSRQPKVVDVLNQLLVISRIYEDKQKPFLLPLINDIFHFLADSYSDQNASLFENIRKEAWVWTGSGFVSSDRLYISKDGAFAIDLRPYLYPLPSEFQMEKIELFFKRTLGLSETPGQLLIKTLAMIKSNNESGRHLREQIQQDLQLVVQILNILKQEPNVDVNDILFPIHTQNANELVFKPASQCNFCNEDWLKHVAEEDGEDIYYIHKNIPLDTAINLGVPSLTERLLENTEGLEEWGQNEQLTKRLNTLLSDYKDGLSIFKELIQNADDAGASKVCFLYDERMNMNFRSKLIDPKMAECQGPALWVYNNALFTEEDIINITKLNGATKALDTTKIGRFGVGFCSVYNLTEVPSFISGNYIIIFDPQRKYLGFALRNKRQPGVKIDIRRNRYLVKRFRSQFSPFQGVFGCELYSSIENAVPYQGTLFRFPLRTNDQADQSEISKTIYDKEEMIRLLQLFVNSSGDLLLFAQNVISVEVYHLQADKENVQSSKLIFQVNRDFKMSLPKQIQYEKINLTRFLTEFQNIASSFGNILKSFSCIWKVSILSAAESDLGIKEQSSETTWLVTWTNGTHKSKELAAQNANKGVLPVSGIACPIEEDSTGVYHIVNLKNLPTGFYNKGHVFCFLPLPIETNLPVHINSYFAVTTDRQRLCSITTDDKNISFEVNWNKALIEDAACKAYLCFLVNLQMLNINPDEDYFRAWPTDNAKYEVTNILQKAFYNAVCKNSVKVFRNRESCLTFNECCFVSPEMIESEFGYTALEACKKWLHNGLTPVKLSNLVYSCFIDADCDSFIGTKILSTYKFFEVVVLPNIKDKFWDGERNKLILFILNSSNQSLKLLLKGVSCIPTKPNGTLRHPNEIVHRSGEASVLFDVKDERFILSNFETKNILNELEILGMMINKITEDLVIDRAVSVASKLACSKCSLKRCNDFLRYLMNNINQIEGQLLSRIRTIPFLPVMRCPPDWEFTWAEDTVDTKKPAVTNICMENCHDKSVVIKFERPENLCMCDCFCLVGTVCPIISKDVYLLDNASELLLKLGVRSKQELDIKSILEHLMHVATSERKRKNFEYYDEITFDIYRFLDAKLRANHPELQMALGAIKDMPCVYVLDTFVIPRKIFQNISEDCRPYFYSLANSRVRQFGSFLKCIGIKENISFQTIIEKLTCLRNAYMTKPLSEDEVKMYICLLRQLSEAKVRENMPITSLQEIKVPDVDSVLTSRQLLCVDESIINTSQSMKFTHISISPALASSLGIPTKRQRKVKNCSRSKSFGQREPLTNRIKRILNEYPCDSGFLKEFLQNSDDAKATELHIIADFESHPSDKVFSESWKHLQGPALLIYNDSSFSEVDLEGIQNLGVGSKRNDPSKTGKYGVGFNVVYHFTDVPSFLTKGHDVFTGQILCVMDPSCKYVEEATPSAPGIEYFNLQEIWEDYPDVFDCYHSDLLMKEKGTIFRLPLRTHAFVKCSKLSKKAISENKVCEILKQFIKEIPEMLLFLNNVQRIKISQIKAGSLHEEYSAEVTFSDKEVREKFNLQVHKASNIFSKSASLQDSMKSRVHYQAIVKESSGQIHSWLLIRQLGFSNNRNVLQDDVTRAIQNGDLIILPRGDVAFNLNQANDRNVGKLFCFLPLNDVTGIPVHLNGHFSLEYESRRSLWNQSHETFRSEWNKMLFTNIVAPVYVAGLEYMIRMMQLETGKKLKATETQFKLRQYYNYFPNYILAKNDYMRHLISSVYKYILESNSKVFVVCINIGIDTNIIEFYPFNHQKNEFQVVFDSSCSDESNTNTSKTKTNNLCEVCKHIGVRLTSVPLFIFESIRMLGFNFVKMSPEFLVRFLKSVDLLGRKKECAIIETSFRTVDNLKLCVEYCMAASNFIDDISKLPFCLRQDNCIQLFGVDHAVFDTKLCHLLPESASLFLHSSLVGMLPANICGIKLFTVSDFANLLPYTISTQQFKTNNGIVVWDPDSVKLPNKNWIELVWKFIEEEIYRNPMPKERILHKLENIISWCLVPCKVEKYDGSNIIIVEHYLYSLEKINNIIHEDTIPRKFQNVLRVLQLPISGIKNKLVQFLTTSFFNKLEALKCFDLHVYKLKMHVNFLRIIDCNNILEYFSACLLEEPVMKLKILSLIRSLPFHVTVRETPISLEKCKKILVLQDDIPKDGIFNWAINTETTLLKENIRLENLYCLLECSTNNVYATYTQYILPSFQMLPLQYHTVHLQYIRDQLLACSTSSDLSSDKKMLIKQMKDVKCVPDTNGVLRKASDLYNPFNPVMLTMCDPDKFPCHQFRKESWRKFLEMAGIQSDITVPMAVKIISDIAEGGRTLITDDIRRKSEIMVRYIINNGQKHLLRDIRHIKFVVPYLADADKCSIYPQHNPDKLICFAGSQLPINITLCWSTCSVISEEFFRLCCDQKVTNYMLEHLEIPRIPESKAVVLHIQNVVDELHRRGNRGKITTGDALFIERLMGIFYDWLEKNIKQTQVVNLLKQKPVAFLPKRRLFVNCNRIVENINEDSEIRTYLLKAPDEFRHYFVVFNELGMQPKLSCYHYIKVLEYLYIDVCNEELSEKDLQIVRKALSGISKQSMINEEDLKDIDCLYLPTVNKKLDNASNMIYSDHAEWQKMLEKDKTVIFFIDLTALEMAFGNEASIFNNLPQRLRPQILSQIVQKHLNKESMETVETKAGLKLKNLFRRLEFWQGFVRIIAQFSCNAALKANEFNTDDANEVLANVKLLKLHLVNVIDISIIYKGKLVGQCYKKSYFDIESRTLYCAFPEDESLVVWLTDNSNIISTAFQQYTKKKYLWNENLLLKMMLLFDDVGKISAMLDRERVPRFHVKIPESVSMDPGVTRDPNPAQALNWQINQSPINPGQQFNIHTVEPARCPNEAKLWFGQAKNDFCVATTLMQESIQCRAFNWICFLCHQSAEKALHSLHYNRDSHYSPGDRNLWALVSGFGRELQSTVRQLTNLLGKQENMLYPNRMNFPLTPSELYTKEMAETGLEYTDAILRNVQSILYENICD